MFRKLCWKLQAPIHSIPWHERGRTPALRRALNSSVKSRLQGMVFEELDDCGGGIGGFFEANDMAGFRYDDELELVTVFSFHDMPIFDWRSEVIFTHDH